MIKPQIGGIFKFDGVNWTVLNLGDNIFEHESNKGIFAFVNLDEMDCLAVLIRDKKVKITVDPTIPSIKADNEELLKEYGDAGTYVLLKYERKNN